MSVLIKGAKPPSGCRWCYFNEDSKCALIVGCDFDDTNGTKRRKDCPLIELPDHGDLVDADEVMKTANEMAEYWETEYEMPRILQNANVIIPAERSEDATD